jgi:hypothetical protein
MSKKKEPKPGMEYIYGSNYAFPLDEDGEYEDSVYIEMGTVITHLRETEDGGYNFIVKDTEQRFYMDDFKEVFWENTPENQEPIEDYLDAIRTMNRMHAVAAHSYAKIKTLDNE